MGLGNLVVIRTECYEIPQGSGHFDWNRPVFPDLGPYEASMLRFDVANCMGTPFIDENTQSAMEDTILFATDGVDQDRVSEIFLVSLAPF